MIFFFAIFFLREKNILWNTYIVQNKDFMKAILFFFLIWVLQAFQEYFTYIEPIVHQRWAKTREPGEKPPDHP